MSFQEQLEQFKRQFSNVQLKVDYATHKVTTHELNNLAYLTMNHVMGWPMREADFHVILTMAHNGNGQKPITSIKELDEKFIPELSEYMWDHLLGEPEAVTPENIGEIAKILRDHLYSMDEATRNDIEPKEAPPQ